MRRLFFSAVVFIGLVTLSQTFSSNAQTPPVSTFDADKALADGPPIVDHFAFSWPHLSENYLHALNNVCIGQAQGIGVPKDAISALKYCKMAADDGDAKAAEIVAELYIKGDQIPRDYANAMSAWRWRFWTAP